MPAPQPEATPESGEQPRAARAGGRRPDILILSASVGAGHRMAADALRDALGVASPRPVVTTLDAMDYATLAFRAVYRDGYDAICRHAPPLMRRLYQWSDQPSTQRAALRTGLQRWHCAALERTLQARQPDLIINTHFLPAELASQMRGRGALRCPIWTVVTDLRAFRLWVQPDVHRYFVGSQDAVSDLVERGAPAASITLSGIPLRSAFLQPGDRLATRRRLGLATDRPVVLVACGGRAARHDLSLVAGLMRSTVDVQIVALLGRRPRLAAALRAAGLTRDAQRLQLLPFTHQIADYMNAADILVTKAGGLTCSEALALQTPLVLAFPVPGHEERNAELLVRRGAARSAASAAGLIGLIDELLRAPSELENMRRAAAALARPRAAEYIASAALIELGQTPPIGASGRGNHRPRGAAV